MKIFLTDSSFDKELEHIADGSNEHELVECIDKWKKLKHVQDMYRIQPYNRILFYPNNIRIVDFGDYHYFLKIVE